MSTVARLVLAPAATALLPMLNPHYHARSRLQVAALLFIAVAALASCSTSVDGAKSSASEPIPSESAATTEASSLLDPTVVPDQAGSANATATPTTSVPEAELRASETSGVAQALAALTIADFTDVLVAELPYDRDDYAPRGWVDSDGDCQSDRHEILIEESQITTQFSDDGCRVETGQWVDRLDGTVYQLAADVTIDHHVALSAAHRAGAWRWDQETKQRFASDISFPPAHGVTGPSTNQAKADAAPDRWKPPLESAWCSYALDWVAVKTRWELAYSKSEVAALTDMLATCDEHTEATMIRPAEPTIGPMADPTPIAAVEVTDGPADVRLASCDVRAEKVVLENRGSETIELADWVLHDEGRNHEFDLTGLSLAPGQRVAILTGDNIVPARDAVVWKRENIWNNSGDTAFLLHDTKLIDSLNC